MQIALIILVSVGLSACTACGQLPQLQREVSHKVQVASDFRKDFDRFLDDAEKRDCQLIPQLSRLRSISYGKQIDASVGVCWMTTLFGNIITIRKDVARSELLSRTLLYHELGHCLLLLDHFEDTTSTGVEVDDIMNPALPLLTEENWEANVDKLFRRGECN